MTRLPYILLALLLTACAQEEEIVITTESEILNEMLRAAPLQVIDLDETPVDTIYVETFIDFSAPALEKEEILISADVRSLNHTDNYFYVFTQGEPFIVQFDRQGRFIESIGRAGQGPNEYGFISNVSSNGSYLYILDGGNARINVYDHEMNYKGAFTKDNINIFPRSGNNTPASDKFMLFQKSVVSENVVNVVSTDSTHNILRTFLPALIPPGMQPQSVNNLVAGISDAGIITLSYLGLPYLLFFDNSFVHVHSIVLEADEFSELISSLEPRADDGAGIGARHITSHIRWINDETLLIVNGLVMTILTKEGERYAVQGRYKLEYADPEIDVERPYGVNLTVVHVDGEYFYATSPFDTRVNRVALSEMGS